MSETHFRTCHLCEAMCGLAITVSEGQIRDIRGDPDDPFSRGHLCPKGAALGELRDDPDRLETPLIRGRDGRLRPATWEEALDLVARRIGQIQGEHGHDAVAIYLGNPTVHNHGALLFSQAFMRTLKSRNRYDANSLDANPRLLACALLYGDPTALPVPDVDRTEYLLMLGANPAASNGSLLSMGDVKGRLKAIKARGGRFVLVDPRRTETADWATEHVFIRPGSDAAFVMALIHTVFGEGLVRVDVAVAEGIEHVRNAALPFTPDAVATLTGISADTTRRIAREFSGSARAVAYGRIGTCLQEYGTVASWAIDVLNVLTGNFDREGGLLFPEAPIDLGILARRVSASGYGRWRSRVRGLPELTGLLPVATLPDEIETPGPGQVRGLVVVAGNPVRSAPDSARFERALGSLDFLVCIDPYVGETARLAHVVLPPTDALERPHMDVLLQSLAVRNIARFSEAVFPKKPGAKHDWEILAELGDRLGGLRFGHKAVDSVVALATRAGVPVTPERLLDVLLRLGPYGAGFIPFRKGLTLERLKLEKHGKDLGPLRPGGRQRRVLHANQRVQLAPIEILRELERLESKLVPPETAQTEAPPASDDSMTPTGTLALIGRRHVRSNNSWLHNLPSLMKGKDRTALWIHPSDAKARGIAQGDAIVVTSAVGTVKSRAELTDGIMVGVVSLPHGYGHAVVKDTLRVAGRSDAPNLNALTDSQHLDRLSGTAALNDVSVTVTRLAGQ